MHIPDDDISVKQSIHKLSSEESIEAARLLLKSLDPIQAKASKEGFGFLAYLLRLAILEAQTIASGNTGETDERPYDAGGSPYKSGS